MDRAPAPLGRRVRAVVSPWWRPAFVAMVVLAVGVLVAGLLLPRGDAFLVMPVFLGFYAWEGWRLAHATVDVDGTGMTIHRFRRRRLAWSDVRALRLDPRGGPRILRAETARGVLVELPLLDEEGTEAVLAAHAAAQARR